MTALTVVASLLVCVAVLLRLAPRPGMRTAGLALGLVAWAALLLAIAPANLRDHWWVLVVLGDIAVLAAWMIGAELAGRERWLLLAGAVTFTVRVPVPVGGEAAMLLAPFYLVVGIGAAVLLRAELAALAAPVVPASRPEPGRATRLLDVAVASVPAFGALSVTWSIDCTASAEDLALFLVPFALAYLLVRSWLVDARMTRTPALGILGVATVAAFVGLYQAMTRTVWWNPKVIDANRFRPDVRVNAIYWDPNIFGRVLVVALLGLVATMLVMRLDRRRLAIMLAFGAILIAALWNTYSQSSWVALAAASTVLAVLTLPPRLRRWIGGAVLLVALAGLPFAASTLNGADARTRRDIVRTGVSLAADHPLVGSGLGTFEQATHARTSRHGTRDNSLAQSHFTPVTVLAELGVVGLALYLLLLAAGAAAVLARWKRSSTPAAAARAAGARRAPSGWPSAPVIWATATFVAIVAHSLLYASFFEDPAMWVALAVLAGLPATQPGPAARAAGPGA